MRAAIVACTVAGTCTSSTSPRHTYGRDGPRGRRARRGHARSPQRRTGCRRHVRQSEPPGLMSTGPRRAERRQRRPWETSSGARTIASDPAMLLSAPRYSGTVGHQHQRRCRGKARRSKSTSMDSLTSSIQCTSSITYSAGRRARRDRSVDQSRQPTAPGVRIDDGQLVGRISDAEQIVQQRQIIRGRIGQPCPQAIPCESGVEVVDPEEQPQQSRHRVERNVPGVGLTERREHLRVRGRRRSTWHSAVSRLLPMPAGPTMQADTSCTANGLVENRVQPVHFPPRPISVASSRSLCPGGATPIRRRAGTGSSAPLMRTHSGSPSVAIPSTNRALASLNITPPGGAIDSMRCAKPT